MSSDEIAVRADRLGKAYRIRDAQVGETMLSRAVWTALRHPLQARRRTEFWALQDVSFSIRFGEAVGVIGRNGAGKSTLLKVISQVTEPTTGEVTYRGRVGSLLEVGTGFHPELTGRENIYLNGAVLGMTRAEVQSRFAEIVEFAGVERFLDTPVKRYSSGMYVRLAFSVAAHLEPDILIVDEVLAVGDAAFQRKCLGRMGEVAAGGDRAVVFVSHNMAAIESLCTRCIVLDQGTVAFDGDPREAVAHYTSRNRPTRGGEGAPGVFETFAERVGVADRELVTRVEVHDDRGDVSDTVRSEHAMTFVVDVDAEALPPDSWIHIGLYAQNDEVLTHFGCEVGPLLDGAADAGGPVRRLDCRLDPLLLLPGEYYFNVGIREARNTEWLELNHPVGSFTVVEPLDDEGVYGGQRFGYYVQAARWGPASGQTPH